ncbi:hypothetical protein [Devosia sp. SL43]|uniref:hypothetical protein n=1 Tax=Devosia sp. SL43 TaxID=2806348 RepID=UPI001F3B0309|nr:hypothetical protein [Devosia sp. SL43]UJW84964.1 hypothetical protein IM737_16335 [Devosia sp. SL43]
MQYDLSGPPANSSRRSVTAESAEIDGRLCTRVSLTAEATAGVAGIDYIDMPTFLRIPANFVNGSISVDIRSRLRSDAPDYARAFAGIAYRISADCQRFEAVYVRPLNGLKLNPPAPRDRRALQYFAYPDWKFDRLRDAYPDGRYEAGANIGPDEWLRLNLVVGDRQVNASVNGIDILSIEAKSEAASGDIGLWVDIGTEAYFSNLHIIEG